MSKRKFGPGYVYLMRIKGTNVYKIGQSVNPSKRLWQLNNNMPYEVEIIHKILVENMRTAEDYLHRIFREKHLKGEWFALDEIDVEVICKCQGKNDDEICYEIAIVQKYFQRRSN